MKERSRKKEIYSTPQLSKLGKIVRETKGATVSTCDGNGTPGNGSNQPCL